ncbi:mismatch-specific DNA-glycosylase [Bacillus lacus]|uniref:Mismatch-specific DNA-glycosylase n=1 Tax=Metabacillus lacus TaxID=1983721 RepID=A0A7X2J090_9BACI|nr:mismatch-specific DNA-glycosylase [Metabacillus lacus]MRX72899.1 mismatch-specific DNA-glycosylase [Metabacillus lacus]
MQKEVILELIGDHVTVLFVGFNPSLASYQTGHRYASKHNRFYKLLYLSGITERLYLPQEDILLFEKGFGFTNLAFRPTKTAREISAAEYEHGRKELSRKLKLISPKVCCFVGKGVYLAFTKLNSASWGFQEYPLDTGVQFFVAPSSSGLVRMPMEEILRIYSDLAQYIMKENLP